jgi:DNA-binding CsgD family transcriptional regulator
VQLLERSQQLDNLQKLLDEAASRRGRLVFLGGEAGVGKTALVGWFAERARRRARVLVGASDALATPRPLAPLLDMGIRSASRGDSGPELYRAFLGEIGSGRQPTLAVFEDVHWADQATLDLLRFVGRRVGTARALIVATFRDDEVGRLHPLRILLGDLATQPAVARMTLAPLSLDAVALLARGTTLDPAHLHRKTGGNPFFITEVLLSGLEGIPASVSDAVLARASRLSPQGRQVLDAAAICGLRAEPWLLEAVVGPTQEAMAECVETGLLRPDGAALAFRHELAREAVAEAVELPRAVSIHRTVMEVLLGRPERETDPARIAYHAEAAGDGDVARAYATEAARRAARFGAHREAAAEYGRALRFADGIDPADRARLLEGRAFECFVSDQLDASLEARQAALAIWHELGDRRREGDNLRWLARAHWVGGRARAAEEAAVAAVEVLESVPPSRELAIAYAHRGHLSMLLFRNRDALEWCDRALAALERFDDPEARVHALINRGIALVQAGDDGGFQVVEEAIRLGQESGLVDHVARACFHCVQVTTAQRRHRLSETWFERGHAYCVEHEHEAFRQFLLAMRARSLLNQGRWDEAEATARAVLDRAHSPDFRRLLALTTLGLLRARRGGPGAMDYLAESEQYLAPLGPELGWSTGMLPARAEVAWLAGDTAMAQAEAASALESLPRPGEPWGMGELAYWLWRGGGSRAVPKGAARPWALQLAGSPEEAAHLWEELGCPYEAAQALAESDEEPDLRRALDTFVELGARPAAAHVRRRLHQLGARGVRLGPRASTRRNPAQLTARELEVLGLLAEGMANGEIAERLFVSPRTVDHQVASILGKLGVASRTAAAREASRLGITSR